MGLVNEGSLSVEGAPVVADREPVLLHQHEVLLMVHIEADLDHALEEEEHLAEVIELVVDHLLWLVLLRFKRSKQAHHELLVELVLPAIVIAFAAV